MKTFLTTMKGKIIAGIATVGVVGAVAVAVAVMNSGYRTIAVEELNGITQILNQGGTSDAYVGQHLKSGDDVTVTSDSDLTLAIDTDKYMFAKENTHFWVEAKGKKSETRTKVHLDKGSTLCRIDNKLASTESFDVETPNATMSVRGTVYRASCYKGASGDAYTVVDVLEGEVYVEAHMENGESTEESRLLPAGKRAIIRSNPTVSEFVKVVDYGKLEEIKELGIPSVNKPGKGAVGEENVDGPKETIENENDEGSGEGEADEYVGDIDYSTFEQNEALFLGKAIDEGRELSIGKELLYDIVELIKHDFSGKSEEVAATCEEDGYYYDICTICGLQGDKHISTEKLGHDYVAKAGDNTVEICKNCGKEIHKETLLEIEQEQETVVEPVPPVVIEVPVDAPEAGDGTTAPVVEEPVVEEKKSSSSSSSSSSGGSSSSGSGSSCAHSVLKEVTTEATCKAGKIEQICSSCGAIIKTIEIEPVAEHTYGNDLTYDVDGHTMTCSVCGEKETVCHDHYISNITVGDNIIGSTWPILRCDCGENYESGHTVTGISNTDTTHTLTCSCGATAEDSHSYLSATHTYDSDKKEWTVQCSICGLSVTHEVSGKAGQTGATWTCVECGDVVTVSNPPEL